MLVCVLSRVRKHCDFLVFFPYIFLLKGSPFHSVGMWRYRNDPALTLNKANKQGLWLKGNFFVTRGVPQVAEIV